MSAPLLILAGVALLAGVGLGILALLIAGIRRGDRGHLTNAPGSHPDAIARRLLVGVRYPSHRTATREKSSEPSYRTYRNRKHRPPLHRPAMPEVQRASPLVSPQGMAYRQIPDPQDQRKEVIRP